MLGQRLRRWPNITPTLVHRLVFASYSPANATHRPHVGPMVDRCVVFASSALPANTRHRAIVGSMLVHRLRRWPNIKPTMAQCLVFAGLVLMCMMWVEIVRDWGDTTCVRLRRLYGPRILVQVTICDIHVCISCASYFSICPPISIKQKPTIYRSLYEITDLPSKHEIVNQCMVF